MPRSGRLGAGEVGVDGGDHHGPLADRRGHPLDGPSADVTDSEHPGHRRHEAIAGDDEPLGVELDAHLAQPGRAWVRRTGVVVHAGGGHVDVVKVPARAETPTQPGGLAPGGRRLVRHGPPTSLVDGLYNGAVTDLSVGQDVGAEAAAVDQLPKYALGREAFQM